METALVQKRRIRGPVGAGLFYPDDRKELMEYLKSFDLEESAGGNAQAIIAPHGAWSYSGSLAARAFSSAIGRKRKINRVVILGPIHDKREKGIFLSNSHYFYTPLGNIPVDTEISEELEFNSEHIEINDIPHLGEHSIEIILPFVKYCFPRASIIPVLMGQPDNFFIRDLAKALKTVITPILDETLIVVSCNLSCDNDSANARFLAQECLRLFSEKDANALASAILDGKLNACGGALVVSLFESGLLRKTKTCLKDDNMVSAVDAENNTVFYSEVSFI
ncbi:MAG: AmmeMemoRadiSam system protein B [Treponema sp.]|nr:AmmeMemoRadiSam system protein B [Treponema sp.]MCL2271865.1 AmmeMemoRadiSam system protein B [Treponema sp.]